MLVAHRTDVGLHRRRNEDALLEAPERGLFVVADGMGGHPAGDLASRIAIATIDGALPATALNGSDDGLMSVLAEALAAADRAVNDHASTEPDRHGMGTTAVVAHLSADERLLTIAHIGDSRAYVLHGGAVRHVTADHVRGGPFGRTLTQAIGSGRGVDPEAAEVELGAGDRVLLCTDGLTDLVDDGEIGSVLGTGGSADECCERLLRMALDRGGHDNVTVLLVDPQPG